MFGLDSIWHWLILLVVVLLLFGAGKIRHVGRDLGAAIGGFRKGLGDEPSGEAIAPSADRAVTGEKRQP